MDKRFQKRIEDFACLHCGAHVSGDGYTNHCPHCLWSRHVDVNPGDRASECGGMMQPILLEGSSPNYRILHRCEECGYEKVNDVDADDSTDALVDLAEHPHTTPGTSLNRATGKEDKPLAEEKAYVDHVQHVDRGD